MLEQAGTFAEGNKPLRLTKKEVTDVFQGEQRQR
jgi:hypothetical protein